MSRFIEPVTLTGRNWVVLEPMERRHADELLDAAKDGELWNLWYTGVATPDAVMGYMDAAMRMRDELGAMPFVVRRKADGKMVGSTRYFNVDAKNRRLEIGHTWYSRSVQRTGLNTEAKLILLKHAFEKLDCVAVEFRTHWFNFDSREAIARLGAKQDGVLRNHQISPNGTLRDTVVFSIIASEWPTVKAHLRWQLNKPRA
ncbi:GNAT family N-acetyltransferase [Hydrogenophaga sp. IBVHS1]|uniref:GNAT family N-acetyltransferase n=1 Tax=unclassified Hydrogenophaga TaxID=2610897 RepID=UPI000A2D857C|nr:GNAT family protein [Hydrogenophaga sp. IBVHS1]OSZ73303.1 GNAT family N-acetyltransferase [Hydrogenophaga sp. IBVHS1]